MESGLDTLVGGPSNSVSSGWERPRGRDEHGTGLDRTGSGLKPILAG